MRGLSQLLEEIKRLKIQGATNVCLSVLEFLEKNPKINEIDFKRLYYARPTEPLLRNALNLWKEGVNIKILKEIVKKSRDRISTIGKHLFPEKCTVMTHCHSSTVVNTIIKAKNEGKKILVYVTETRPKNQGLITARELLEAGVPIKYIVDNAAHYYMKECDMFVFGGDAILYDGSVVNKIGTMLMTLSAKYYGVKVYSFCSILKYDPETEIKKEPIEMRNPTEVTNLLPKNLILNPAFEVVESKYIDGIVTEVGILSPSQVKYEFYRYVKKLKRRGRDSNPGPHCGDGISSPTP